MSFALMLQVRSPDGRWHNVMRCSTHHANEHVNLYSRGRVKPTRVLTAGPIDHIDDVHQAYLRAVEWAYPQAESLIERWQEQEP